jgi:hypothetical protein
MTTVYKGVGAKQLATQKPCLKVLLTLANATL